MEVESRENGLDGEMMVENDELKRLEEILKEKQKIIDALEIEKKHLIDDMEEYRIILENSNDIPYRFDEEMRLTFIGPQVEEYGLNLDHLLGENIINLIHHEDVEDVTSDLKRTIETGEEFHTEFRIETPKKGIRYFEDIGKMIYENEMYKGGAGVIRDTTSRKEAELALKKSEEKYRMVINNVNDIIWMLDFDLKLHYVSPSSEKVVGYSPEEAINLGLERLLTEESLKEAERNISLVLGRENEGLKNPNPYLLELEQFHKDGSIVYTDVSMNLLRDEAGNPQGIMGVSRDVTQRKKAERALIDNQRLRVMEEIYASISHDFNNSFQIMSGELALAMMDEEISDKVKEHLTKTMEYISDASSRVSYLQRFASEPQSKGEYSPLDINQLLDDVITPLESSDSIFSNEMKKITMEREYGNLKKISGRENELKSAIYGIIKNSIQAMPDGGKLTFETEEDEKGVYVRIIDTGKGMTEHEKQRIFDPLYSTKGFERGRGMGMNIAYVVTKEHRGEISVKSSEPGKGTTIELKLPYDKG